jgi:hypothetical protein
MNRYLLLTTAAAIVAIVILFLMWKAERNERIRWEGNYTAALNMYGKDNSQVQNLTRDEFKQHFPEIKKLVEDATGEKLRNIQSLITGIAVIQHDTVTVLKRDTLTIDKIEYIGRSAVIVDDCINQTVFIPDSADTVYTTLSARFQVVSAFTKARESKKGNKTFWPFGKKVERGHLKVMCGETAIQDSVFTVKFQ